MSLRPADFRAPLREKVDVVILTEDGRLPIAPAAGSGDGGGGLGRGAAPGARAVRPEYADLVTPEDLARFDQFVRGGGTVVCLGGASTFAIAQFKLPVRNVVAGLKPEEYFLRGSLVEVTTDPTHPVMAGMPEKAAVFVDGSPVFETLEGFTGRVLAKYQETGSPLLSGYLDRREVLARQGCRARRAGGSRARRAARVPAAVARPAVWNAARAVQLGVVHASAAE